ncbi:hypothetical protein CTEN210_02111 [Chaetoceros tenuissimus]|uniref:Uncharacterized protein n=1 Tax=Chaetoceros tenuissimus TaxID=426638 RepID=A0AAD3CGF0_9STRA|nr:hypothetical protein CTEN210_02111 [Chaetoceros tenuissimus]
MRLLSFSSWQECATSISNKDTSSIVHRFIGRPSLSVSQAKRFKSFRNQERSIASVSQQQPTLVLTTNHQISLLGHRSTKKPVKPGETKETSSDPIKELSQWIYSSRPGDSSSFLPKSKKSDNSDKIGAVVDANSRSVFSLQKNNTVLKIWSLDQEVTGPDEDEDSKLVEKVELSSEVVSMEVIPYRKNSNVKIKGKGNMNGGVQKEIDIQGGVIGLLSNGQVFVVLISSERKIQIGFYNKESTLSTRSRRRSTSKSAAAKDTSSDCIYAVAGYSVTSKSSSNTNAGKKRKSSDVDISTSESTTGEITFTTLSVDSKMKGSIVLSKHVITLSSMSSTSAELDMDTGDNSQFQGISATYAKEAGALVISQDMDDKSIRISQLDPTHVGLVYKADGEYFGTILDIRYGECIIEPFALLLEPGNISIVDVVGLSTSIIAVLTSDNLLSVYDVRRSIILHRINVHQIGEDKTDSSGFCYNVVADWFTGTMGILKKNLGDGNVHVSFAKIGIFDSKEEKEREDLAISKPLLKGSYNLARAIASSLDTTSKMNSNVVSPELAPIEASMMDWFSTNLKCKQISSPKHASTTEFVSRVDNLYHGGKNGKRASLCKILDDATTTIEPVSKKASKKSTSISQCVVDKIISTAVATILNSKTTVTQKKDAIDALIRAIESGKLSGRNHFDKAVHVNTSDVLRSLLCSMKKTYDSISEPKKKVEHLPLHLIFSILQKNVGALPEHMLVTMLHYILCHVSDEELNAHWALSKNNEWYTDSSIRVLTKRLKVASSKKENASHEEKELVQSLKRRLAIGQRLFFVEKIVTHSKCNTALLRAALKDGLSQSAKGEVEVLMKVLSNLLRKAGRKKNKGNVNLSSCLSQWLSALVDANISSLLNLSENKYDSCLQKTKKEVSSAVGQTQVLLNLKELMKKAQEVVESNDKKEQQEVTQYTSLPVYGIESLIF